MTPAAARSSDAPAGASNDCPWLADRGDGSYCNPVLFADYSDPDAIRIGKDYWMVASSFNHVPGLPLLHSRDLVNWRLAGHALKRLVPDEHFSAPRHGGGVWAPAIRHHAGRVWIFYPDPDFGIYQVHADDPRGEWSQPVLVKAGKGLIDPCPFWDDDGKAYLVHGWAKSRSGISNRLTLHRMEPLGTGVLDEGTVVVDGASLPGWNTIEGPKLYKRGGWYYIFAPAGGVATGYQAVFRSASILGPYEHRIVLQQGSTPVNGPHQGAWVDTEHGTDWFLHFQQVSPTGRVVHLQPLRWDEHGWLQIGNGGEPVETGRMPAMTEKEAFGPVASDSFTGEHLGPQWQWQANPAPGWASLTQRPGFLRLAAVPAPAGSSLWGAPNLLLQKVCAPSMRVTVSLDVSGLSDESLAGLVVFGYSYSYLGVRRMSGRARLVLASCQDAHRGGAETCLASLDLESDRVLLVVDLLPGERCQYSAGTGGRVLARVGPAVPVSLSAWVGAKVGLFALAPSGSREGGHVESDLFQVSALRAS